VGPAGAGETIESLEGRLLAGAGERGISRNNWGNLLAQAAAGRRRSGSIARRWSAIGSVGAPHGLALALAAKGGRRTCSRRSGRLDGAWKLHPDDPATK